MKKLIIVLALFFAASTASAIIQRSEEIPSVDYFNEPSSLELQDKAVSDLTETITDKVPGAAVMVNNPIGVLPGILHDIDTMRDRYDSSRCWEGDDSYTAATNAIKGLNCSRGIAELACPDCQYVPFLIVNNVTVGNGSLDIAIAIERVSLDSNMGNLQKAGEGKYYHAKAGIMHGKNCAWITGGNETISIVRFTVLG